MGAVDVDGLAGKQWPDHVDRLDEPVDPRATRVEPDARGVVLGFHMAGTEAELEAASGDRGDGRGLAGGSTGWRKSLFNTRVPMRRREWPPRRPSHPRTVTRCDQVIGNRQHVKTRVLHRDRECAEVRAAGQRGMQAETKRA